MITGTPHFSPWVEDPDEPDYWTEHNWKEFRFRVAKSYGRQVNDARVWEEEKHPRDEDGKWTSGGLGSSGSAPKKDFNTMLRELKVPKDGEFMSGQNYDRYKLIALHRAEVGQVKRGAGVGEIVAAIHAKRFGGGALGSPSIRSESIIVQPDPRIDARAPAFEVLKNGSYDELMQMAKEEGGSLRVSLDEDGVNLYAWDSEKALHEHVEDKLGFHANDLHRDVWTLHKGKLYSEASLITSLSYSGKVGVIGGSNVEVANDRQLRVAHNAVRDWVDRNRGKVLAISGGGVERTPLPDKVVEAFTKLAEEQRDAPEIAMLRAQRAMGGGVMQYMVENGGDLTHRMSEFAKYGDAGYEHVATKVGRLIYRLDNEYGFEREMEENIRANAKNSGVPEQAFRERLDRRLADYVEAHRRLPVYNEMQWHAREAAISIGEKDFKAARAHLAAINKNLTTQETWKAAAFEYEADESGAPKQWTPKSDVALIEHIKMAQKTEAGILMPSGHAARINFIAKNTAIEHGVDPSTVNTDMETKYYNMEGAPTGGSKYAAQGTCNLNNYEVMLYPQNIFLDGVFGSKEQYIRGIVIHELGHVKLETVRDAMRTEYMATKDFPGLPTPLKDRFAKHENSKALIARRKGDGITAYSRQYWTEFEKEMTKRRATGNIQWLGGMFLTSQHETIAEMMRIKDKTGELRGTTAWKSYYNDVMLTWDELQAAKKQKAAA